MDETNLTADEIFTEAALIESVDRRQAFVRKTCGEDHQLLQQVESLLCAHDQADSFLETPVLPREATDKTEDIFRETCGSVIGRYKLLQRIGEGGFGVVYMAEQKRPVRRKVALKLIKAGMDTREVIARFEAERQALAMMDHPNIAKVYDAGSSESGRPYFVMELVRGVSITEFCDANKLSVRERLGLFASVCKAVQHAHQKGIIHRDLKPSNVLVTTSDGELMTKVIDFGVAKAINQELTEKTLFTAYGQMVGTPQYMSPEQAQISAMDVDTRSDVYALGALLYELLTGTTPLDAQRLRSSGFEEMRRIIREEDPPVPSHRLSTLEQQLATVATNRAAEAPDLRGAVRGELDWIVMKALDKDRRRRYQSANDFAADVENYLSGETVAAVAPTVGYRMRKFVRRNRVSLAIGAVLLSSLIIGLIGTSWMAIEANRQQRVAFAALDRVQDELRWRAFMLALSGQREELEQVLKDVDTSKAPNEGWAQRVRGIAAHESGDSAAAVTLLKEAIELGDHTVAAYGPIVSAYYALNDNPGAVPYARVREDLLESNDYHTLEEELFVAYWACWDEPQRAYEIVNRVFARYPSPAVLRVRANICRSFGNHTGDVKWFERAIADGHAQWRAAGKKGAPEFPMWCHASIIDIAKANGDQETVDYHTLVGKRLAAELKQRPDYGAAYTAAASAVFYEAIGDLESAEEAHRIGAESTDNGKRKYAAFLVTHCHDERAMAIIDRMNSPHYSYTTDICRVAALAESPATRPQVRELILERLAKTDHFQWVGFLHQFGFPVEAKREAMRIVEKYRANGESVPPAFEFFAYLMDEEQLKASARNDRLLLADVHFRIIQRHLGEGNREFAKECLEKWPPILRERAHDDLLLTRMRNLWERDPNWPHWIPIEATTEQN